MNFDRHVKLHLWDCCMELKRIATQNDSRCGKAVQVRNSDVRS